MPLSRPPVVPPLPPPPAPPLVVTVPMVPLELLGAAVVDAVPLAPPIDAPELAVALAVLPAPVVLVPVVLVLLVAGLVVSLLLVAVLLAALPPGVVLLVERPLLAGGESSLQLIATRSAAISGRGSTSRPPVRRLHLMGKTFTSQSEQVTFGSLRTRSQPTKGTNSMNLTRSVVSLCVALPSVLACGEAAVEPAQNARPSQSGFASRPATVVSVPEPSAEVGEPLQDANDDETLLAQPVARRFAGYAGEFRGELMSTGEMVPAITVLRWQQGALSGDYTFGHQLDERGTLHDCSETEPYIVRCEWRDSHGTGALELRISSDNSNFDGEWSSEAEPESLHPWTGVRMGEGE